MIAASMMSMSARIIAGLIVCVLLPSDTFAQAARHSMPIRQSLASIDFSRFELRQDPQPTAPRTSSRQRSIGRKIAGGAIGGVGGFFAGGYIGAKIDGECDCDDPGFMGFLIGAPIGAAAGAILGVKFF
jgi:hypothetical protein